MLHRLESEGETLGRHSAADLEVLLEWIRRERIRVVDLATLIQDGVEGRDAREPAVAFTIDDGYHDQADVGIPLFLRYDCPVTTFVATGFLDGLHWMWNDQIAYIVCATRFDSVALDGAHGGGLLRWTDRASRLAAADSLLRRCKSDPRLSGRAFVAALAERLQVTIPASPPPEYRPMQWDDVRRLEARGARFGAHTVWHSVLSHLTEAESYAELRDSGARLAEVVREPSPVFCYPFGQSEHVHPTHMEQARRCGYAAAVVASPGYVDGASLRDSPMSRYQVARFALEQDPRRNMRIVNGFERLREMAARR